MKDPADDKTIDPFEVPKKKRPGRKPRGKRALTDAEKQRAYRARKAEEAAQATPVAEKAEIEVAELIKLIRVTHTVRDKVSDEREKLLALQVKLFRIPAEPADVAAYEDQKKTVKTLEAAHTLSAENLIAQLKMELCKARISPKRLMP
jgi:hypothetical protein|tara:strand:+ start:2070 stop:2513 length:444 start_codon:yes stop_codon:yes gene_type:complete